jgi:hypothetical protein
MAIKMSYDAGESGFSSMLKPRMQGWSVGVAASAVPPYDFDSRPLPGDRVQVDTMKIIEGRFQYTAIDDCTRLRVLGLYPRRTASNAVHFLENRMLEEFPSRSSAFKQIGVPSFSA